MTWPIPAIVVAGAAVVTGLVVWIDDGIRWWKQSRKGKVQQ